MIRRLVLTTTAPLTDRYRRVNRRSRCHVTHRAGPPGCRPSGDGSGVRNAELGPVNPGAGESHTALTQGEPIQRSSRCGSGGDIGPVDARGRVKHRHITQGRRRGSKRGQAGFMAWCFVSGYRSLSDITWIALFA